MPAFISHSFKDEAIYSAICLALDGAHVNRWDPKTMSPGDSLADQLRQAILDCELCIFLATRSAIASPWCLAEVGAFWGSGKTVLVFLADPELTDSILPPQFKGNLMVKNAYELIRAATIAMENRKVTGGDDIKFFETSGKFGGESEWLRLLHDTKDCFDIMGVALLSWRQTSNFEDILLQKAKDGCKVRVLIMHLDNPVLPLLASDFEMLRVNIPQNHDYFTKIAQESGNIEVRQLRKGLMHFFMTRTDQYAVIIQFLASQLWGRGPLWKCATTSGFYEVAKQEFEALWKISGTG
jgi:hypothetical protein